MEDSTEFDYHRIRKFHIYNIANSKRSEWWEHISKKLSLNQDVVNTLITRYPNIKSDTAYLKLHLNQKIADLLQESNGKIEDNYVIFDTEEDAASFFLKWM